MVRDRLKELQEKRNIRDSEGSLDTVIPTHGTGGHSVIQGQDVVIEMGWIDSDIGRFLKQVESLSAKVAELKRDVEKIRYLQGDLLDSLTRDEAKETELDRLMASVKTDTRDLMKKLKEMEEANLATVARMDASEVTLARIQKVQHRSLLKTFRDILDFYQDIQLNYQEKCKTRVKTMLVIRNGNADDLDQFDDDDFVANGKQNFGHMSVFTDGYEQKTENAKQELALADARLNDLLKIETSLKELHDLFLEMSNLIVLQGEKVDNIEKNVTEAVEFVKEADGQLASAKKFQKRARKKCIIIIIILIIVAVILGLVIYFSV